jgi:hypothetical protein
MDLPSLSVVLANETVVELDRPPNHHCALGRLQPGARAIPSIWRSAPFTVASSRPSARRLRLLSYIVSGTRPKPIHDSYNRQSSPAARRSVLALIALALGPGGERAPHRAPGAAIARGRNVLCSVRRDCCAWPLSPDGRSVEIVRARRVRCWTPNPALWPPRCVADDINICNADISRCSEALELAPVRSWPLSRNGTGSYAKGSGQGNGLFNGLIDAAIGSGADFHPVLQRQRRTATAARPGRPG